MTGASGSGMGIEPARAPRGGNGVVFEGVRRGQRPWWHLGLVIVGVTVANLAFVVALEWAAAQESHLSITLAGSSVRAVLGGNTTSEWDAPAGRRGAIAVAVKGPDLTRQPPGIDNLLVQEPTGRILVQESSSIGRTFEHTPQGWRVDYRGRLLASDTTLARIPGVLCADCVIELDLINVQSAEVLVRADDRGNGLLLRWDGQVLAWYEQRNGTIAGAPAHGIARVPHATTSEERHARYGAELASLVLVAYRDGWRFVLRYARGSLPAVVLIILLGAGWRLSRAMSQRPRWFGGVGAFRWRPAWGAVVCAIAVVGIILHGWRSGVEADLLGAAMVGFALSAGIVLVLAIREIVRLRGTRPSRYTNLRAAAVAVVVLGLSSAAAAYSAYLALAPLEGIPHVQDSVSYLMGAKAISTGQSKIPITEELAPFFEMGPFLPYHGGYLHPLVPGLYFAGHPFLLSLGYRVGAPWVVNPICSGLTLILLFLLCRELFGTPTGLLTVALGAISPWARIQSASMLTHPTVLLFVTAGMLFLVLWLKRPRALWAICLGAALGATINIRPYDGAVLGAYVGLVLIVYAKRVGFMRTAGAVSWASLAAAPWLAVLAWQFFAPDTPVRPEAQQLLTWTAENLSATRIRLDALNQDLFGWGSVPGAPYALTLGFLLLAIFVMPKQAADWLMVGWALAYVGAYGVYDWHGNMFGPRYLYGSLGGQLVLVARLIQALPSLMAKLCRVIWPPGRTPRWRWITTAAGAVPMLLLVGPLFWATLSVAHSHYLRTLSSYNGFSAATLRLVADHAIQRAIVFVADLPFWQDEMTALASNGPRFDDDLIFARHVEGRDHVLIHARPGHTPYLITWTGTAYQLGRLRLDPDTNRVSYSPRQPGPEDPRVIGVSNIFRRVVLPQGFFLRGGLHVAADGALYVVDSFDREVLVFDAAGVLRRRMQASYGFGPSAIRSGRGISVDVEGNVYVADADPPGLVCLNADGSFAWRAVRSRDGRQQLGKPSDVAMLPDGNLLVADAASPYLHVLRRDGTFAGYFGESEVRQRLGEPQGVGVGGNGHVFVSDTGLQALVELTSDGTEVHRWRFPTDDVQPVPYVAVDDRGSAYVANRTGSVVFRARPDEDQAEPLGIPIGEPNGLAVRAGNLYILSSTDRRVVELALSDLP